MVTCPKCGAHMISTGKAWFHCPACEVAGHLDGLERLREMLVRAGRFKAAS